MKDRTLDSLLKFKRETGKSYETLGNEIGISGMTIYRWAKGRTKKMNPVYRFIVQQYLMHGGNNGKGNQRA